MNEQELQMLKEVFAAAGAIGTQGFDAMVRYTFASCLTWLIAGFVVLLFAVAGFFVGLIKDFDDTDANATIVVASGLVGIVASLVIASHLPSVIEPVGATVQELLARATR